MANINSFDPVALSIDGGRHTGSLLRLLAYAAVGGNEGVVTAVDCKVHALNAGAGPAVEIDAGGVVIRNRFANVLNQSYVANNRAISRLDVTASGAGGRSDLVIVKLKDPQYQGSGIVGTDDPATFQYVDPIIIENVPAGTKDAAALNLGYPAYALARIDLLPNTTNVTNGMIVNLRQPVNPVHDPNEARTVRVWTPPVAPVDLLAVHTVRQWFPKTNELIYCPKWATRCTAIVSINGLLLHGERCFGDVRVEYGWNNDTELLATQATGFHHEDDIPVEDDSRQTLIVAGSFAVPASFRDKAHYVRTGGVMAASRTNDSWVRQDQWSTVVVDLQFEEVAD